MVTKKKLTQEERQVLAFDFVDFQDQQLKGDDTLSQMRDQAVNALQSGQMYEEDIGWAKNFIKEVGVKLSPEYKELKAKTFLGKLEGLSDKDLEFYHNFIRITKLVDVGYGETINDLDWYVKEQVALIDKEEQEQQEDFAEYSTLDA